jgi:hypothetical protein
MNVVMLIKCCFQSVADVETIQRQNGLLPPPLVLLPERYYRYRRVTIQRVVPPVVSVLPVYLSQADSGNP